MGVGAEMFSPGVVSSLATSILLSTTGFVLAAQDDPYPACYQFFTTWPQASSGIHSDIDSAQSCQLLCVQTEDCVAFSWHFGSDQFDENTCQLFSEIGEETSSCADCVSGPKSCTCSSDVACRFAGGAGSRLTETRPGTKHCGTACPGYLFDGHPSVSEGIVSRTVYFECSSNAKYDPVSIEVLNCGDYYVYHLPDTPDCYEGFCGIE